MLSFKEWRLQEANRSKKKKGEKDVKSSSISSEIGNQDEQGKAARGNSQVEPKGVFIFTEP